ncbi:hypothetical protein [Curtobacterium sp. USHLN213]|uniref:hypothetical protein n=1 Tax=Curtobacterium sp. USHLN213 TaxID=3081255 RepID=UPI00301885A9
MNYKYRVYNGQTGHEYAEVDSHATGRALMMAPTVTHGVNYDDLTIDVLVPEATA